MSGEGSLRVWWVPQVPMKAFEIDVPDLATADLLLGVLADYDAFQFENNVKGDYCNAGGLVMMEADGEWYDWYDDAMNCDFDEWREVYGRRAASGMEAREGRDSVAGSIAEGDDSPAPKGDAPNLSPSPLPPKEPHHG